MKKAYMAFYMGGARRQAETVFPRFVETGDPDSLLKRHFGEKCGMAHSGKEHPSSP